ncbi:MAG TPA: type II toxin-antitoxin system VapC family toxin [Candidatus Angelobacter sp.]|jgi:PIN domain nuclease of toxin-antitoxin system
MKYLLDTAVLLWSVDDLQKLNTRTRQILENRREELFLSPVVSWEIVIKVTRGKLTLARTVSETLNLAFAKFGMQSLPITHAHSLTLGELPSVHNDPFDRMLVAQAKNEGMILVTADAILEKYPVEIMWCGK